MKRRIFILMIALAICAAAYIAYNYNELKTGNKAGGPQSSLSSVKVKAIDFKLQGLDGKELSLNDLKGKKVFLNFWATWCPPCRGEMPDIQKIYKENKDSDLVIVAVDIGEPASNVNTFVEYNKYSFKVLLDSDQSSITFQEYQPLSLSIRKETLYQNIPEQ